MFQTFLRYIKRMYFSFIWLVQHIVPLCFMLSWVYPVAMLVQRIVYEKEQRLKEVTKLFTNFETENYSLLFVLGSYI